MTLIERLLVAKARYEEREGRIPNRATLSVEDASALNHAIGIIAGPDGCLGDVFGMALYDDHRASGDPIVWAEDVPSFNGSSWRREGRLKV